MRGIGSVALAAALGAAALPIAGCAGDSGRLAAIATAVSMADAADPVAAAYDRALAAAIAQAGLERLDKQHGIGPRRGPDDIANTSLRQRRHSLARLAEPAFQGAVAADGNARPARRSFHRTWRRAGQTLYLAPARADSGSAPFAFSGLQADEVEIQVIAVDDAGFRMRLACDGAIAVGGAGGQVLHQAGAAFEIAGSEELTLHPQAGLNRCDAEIAFADGHRSLAIVREEAADPGLAAIDGRYDVCAAPPDSALSPLERVFHRTSGLSQTCAFSAGSPKLLTDKKQGFNAKVAALLGTPLPDRLFRDGDPEAPLDLSKAPDLSLIYLSYLEIKADFSGRILDRLLRHHAARGTSIRIVVSKVLERDKDRAMLEALAADHPNVQLKLFAFSPPIGAPLDEEISRFHKVHHAKMLAVLSKQPGRSTAIIGGRNIHDGFLFEAPLDLSRYPNLQDYRRAHRMSRNYFSDWRDFDIALRDDSTVRMLASHLSTLWHGDAVSGVARPFTVTVPGGRLAQGGLARHFISVPYSDGRALEDHFVALIDAARVSIEIINPFFNMTPDIAVAIERALERGVAITVIGSIDRPSDLAGPMVSALNEMFAESNLDRLAIYDHHADGGLLHAKILMVDGRLVTISSVNLNSRSFIHDGENGISVLDPAFYRRVKTVFEAYREASVRVTDARSGIAWRLLFSSRVLREAF